MCTPTVHNAARKGEIAKTVLMPGDPLRAKYIAEKFLENPKLVNDIRNMYCYTGTYNGKEVSVMGSGMGVGSISIYSYELFNFYDVDQIIRVGSAGALSHKLKLRDVVVGQAACTDSNYAAKYDLPGTIAPCADYGLIEGAVKYGRDHGINMQVGPIYSGAGFYYPEGWMEKWRKMGVLAVEMEAAALYLNAAEAGKKALALCTISDLLFSDEACTAQERQESFDDMIRMALSLA